MRSLVHATMCGVHHRLILHTRERMGIQAMRQPFIMGFRMKTMVNYSQNFAIPSINEPSTVTPGYQHLGCLQPMVLSTSKALSEVDQSIMIVITSVAAIQVTRMAPIHPTQGSPVGE